MGALTPTPVQLSPTGGNRSLLHVTAAAVVKSTPGTLFRVVVEAVGTGGSLTLNDNNATGASNTAANQICSIPYGDLTVGEVLAFKFPCGTGITVSAVPSGGGIVAVSFS